MGRGIETFPLPLPLCGDEGSVDDLNHFINNGPKVSKRVHCLSNYCLDGCKTLRPITIGASMFYSLLGHSGGSRNSNQWCQQRLIFHKSNKFIFPFIYICHLLSVIRQI